MEVIRKNLREDQKLLVSLGADYEGERFKIVFTSGKFGNIKYECSYDGTTYKNCEMADDVHVLCLLDNHGLPCGLVTVEISIYLPDTQMGDGDFKLHEKKLLEFPYEGKMYHMELTNGKSDVITTPEVTFELLGAVLRGEPLKYDDLTDEQKAELKGEKGDKGDKGDDGKDGADGRDGTDGRDGADGRDGVDGKDGKDGKDGNPLYMTFTLDPHNMHLYASEDCNRISINENKHLCITF